MLASSNNENLKIELWKIEDLSQEKCEFDQEDFEKWLQKSYLRTKRAVMSTDSQYPPHGTHFSWAIHTIWAVILNDMMYDLAAFWDLFPEVQLHLLLRANLKGKELEERIRETESSHDDFELESPNEQNEENIPEGEKESMSLEDEQSQLEKLLQVSEIEDPDHPNSKEVLKVILKHKSQLYSVFTVKAMTSSSNPVVHMDYLQKELIEQSNEEGFDTYYGLLTDLTTVIFVRYSRENQTFWLSEPIEVNLDTEFFDGSNKTYQMREITILVASIILRTMKDLSSR